MPVHHSDITRVTKAAALSRSCAMGIPLNFRRTIAGEEVYVTSDIMIKEIKGSPVEFVTVVPVRGAIRTIAIPKAWIS